MTYRTADLLVCVYYRVAAGDSARVIAVVREFQRTLQQRGGAKEAEVLLRCDLPSQESHATLPDARPASVPSLDPSTGLDARVDPGADATVMETYRLPLPAAAGAEADAVVRAFLDTLEAASVPLASLLRGARHVELFAPMCLVALAIDENRRFPLVIATNRDEFFDRPAARMGWWTPAEGGPEILAGRDLQAGGTWLGLTASGRLGLVTNVRRPTEPDAEAPSRGGIVPHWLRTEMRADQFWMQTSLSGYAPFNLIAADFRRGDCFYASNEHAIPRRIERGIFGLSNATLDTPWPKVVTLKQHLAEALKTAESVDSLSAQLFTALADRELAPEDQLPTTGIGRDRERLLSPAFIRTPDGVYGTRCSTIIITEKIKRQLVTHVFERTFTAGPGLALLRRTVLKDWPPRYADRSHLQVETSVVAETEIDGTHVPAMEMPPPAKKTRVRSLLKPISR